jgi:hypothetical protein
MRWTLVIARGRVASLVAAIGEVLLIASILAPRAAEAQQVQWTQSHVNGPSPRRAHAMAYDSARGVTVLFGGLRDNGPSSGETWEWDGAAWALRQAIGPSPRYGHAMAYDSARAVTVLFGGMSGTYGDGETWEWNGTAWTQRQVSGPSARVYHAMAYDSARGVTVLFGGAGGGGNDTWEWDGATWTQRQVNGPSPRQSHAMAYDSARGVTVLFGGVNVPSGTRNNEIWEWDGTAWSQRQFDPGYPAPYPRDSVAMAYDSARAVTVLFGGENITGIPGTPTFYGDTWEWDGAAWTPHWISGLSPRELHAMAYDSLHSMVVLFGGSDIYNVFNGETWQFGDPGLAAQPTSARACVGASVAFSVTAAGTGPFAYRWRYEDAGAWLDMAEGADIVLGAGTPAAEFFGHSQGSTSGELAVSGMRPLRNHPNVVEFRCVVSSGYGTITSDAATLTICPADFNCDGSRNSQDFFDFLSAFFAATPSADFNHDGVINSQDFFDFLTAFFAGCP